MIVYAVLLVMTLMGSVASLFLKKASGSQGFLGMLRNVNLYVGGILYVLSALLNIWVLRFLDYSVVLPLTSLTYMWTMFISRAFLKEKITIRKIIGVVLIIIGAVLVSLKL